MTVILAPPTGPLLKALARTLCDADKRELAAVGHTPLKALRLSVKASYECYVALRGGVPVAAFGVATDDAQVGIPWLLTTGSMDQWTREFMRACRRFITKWRYMHPALHNAVDVRNTRAIRWLQMLGFEIKETLPFGRDGEPFHHMVLSNV